MLDSWDWKEQAACKNQQLIFYPKRISSESVERAKQICAGCPVQRECKQFAETTHEEYGIWAGNDYTHSERARVKEAKKRNKSK